MREYVSDENDTIKLSGTIQGSNGAITSIVQTTVAGGFAVSASDGSVWSSSLGSSDIVKSHVSKTPIKSSAGIVVLKNHIVGVSSQHEDQLIVLDNDSQIPGLVIPPTTSKLISSTQSSFAIGKKNTCAVELSGGCRKIEAGTITVFAISPNGKFTAYCLEKDRTRSLTLQSENRELFVVDSSNMEPREVKTEITTADIVCAAISDDGIIAVASGAQELHVYSPSGEVVPGTVRCWTYHKARITCMQWLKHGNQNLLVTGGLDRNIFVWDPADPANGPIASVKDIHRDGISALLASIDSASQTVIIISGGNEGSVRITNISNIF